jgi:hypothetical protein
MATIGMVLAFDRLSALMRRVNINQNNDQYRCKHYAK